jgi:hypothetical protein
VRAEFSAFAELSAQQTYPARLQFLRLLSNLIVYASLSARGETAMRYELYYQPVGKWQLRLARTFRILLTINTIAGF